MNAVFVYAPTVKTLADVTSLLQEAGFVVNDPVQERLFVARAVDHVWIFPQRNPAEMPPEYAAYVQQIIDHGGMGIWVIEYYSIDLVKRVLSVFAGQHGALIDNDSGTNLPGRAFLGRMQSDPGWDWRSSTG